jgi:geranylgeranyl pyrophosphate synthase
LTADLLSQIWEQSGAWPEFIDTMRLAAFSGDEGQNRKLRLARLPVTCHEGAGGRPQQAEELASAWVLLYLAANIMDSVQDGDPPQHWWVEHGPGMALNTATGLYFSASLLLSRMQAHPQLGESARYVAEEFYRRFLVMCSGQHADLIATRPSLEQFWRLAEAKSGAFFAMACWGGARLAGAGGGRLQAYENLGNHLGVLVQIADELAEVLPASPDGAHGQLKGLGRSLPALFALEVLPAEERGSLLALLDAAPQSAVAAKDALSIMDGCGAGIYIRAEQEKHVRLAMQALQTAAPASPAYDELSSVLSSFIIS